MGGTMSKPIEASLALSAHQLEVLTISMKLAKAGMQTLAAQQEMLFSESARQLRIAEEKEAEIRQELIDTVSRGDVKTYRVVDRIPFELDEEIVDAFTKFREGGTDGGSSEQQ